MLNNINHKMPIYKNCTLFELMITTITTLTLLIIALSVLSKIFIGYLWPGFLLATIFFVFINKFMLNKLQQLKYEKPHAYHQQLVIKKLAIIGLIYVPYVIRIGKWSVRRSVNDQ